MNEPIVLWTNRWSRQLQQGVESILNVEGGRQPLLFRRWPYRSHWLLAVIFASTSIAGLMGFYVLHASQIDIIATPTYDSFIHIVVGLFLCAPLVLVALPWWRAFKERKAGYRFGDYLFDFGYIQARATSVKLHLWKSASLEIHDFRELDKPFTEVTTEDGRAFSFGADFEGDRQRAREAVAAFRKDDHLPTVLAGVGDSDVDFTMNWGKVPRSFYVQLVGLCVLLAFALAVPVSMGLHADAQRRVVEQTISEFQEVEARMMAHEHRATPAYFDFVETCDDVRDAEGELADDLHQRVCGRVDDLEVLTRFDTEEIYSSLDAAAPEYRTVLLERLSAEYRSRRAKLASKFDADDWRGEFADELLRQFEEEPRTEIMLHLRPVVSSAFEENDLLIVLLQLLDTMEREDGQDDKPFGGKEFVPAGPYFTGERADSFSHTIKNRAERILTSFVGRTPAINEKRDEGRYVNARSLLSDFAEAESREASSEPVAAAPEAKPPVNLVADEEGEDDAAKELLAASFDDIIADIPEVDEPTMLVTYLVSPGDGYYASDSSSKVFAEVTVRFVVQWVVPGPEVVWSIDEQVAPSAQIRVSESVNINGERVYGVIAQDAFDQLSDLLREQFSDVMKY